MFYASRTSKVTDRRTADNKQARLYVCVGYTFLIKELWDE